MHEIPYLQEIVVLFGTALAMLAICNRFHIPSIIGFLFTGILTGPSALGWIKDTHHIEVLAELGVVFLLFIIGLELHFERLKKLLKPMLLGGSLQALFTLLIITFLSIWLNFELKIGFFWGMVVTLSSTAIVLKLYQDRNEIESLHGQTALGILLFQDFLIVPFILIVPLLSGNMDGTGLQILIRFGSGLALIGVILLLGRYVLPHLLHIIVLTRVKELLVLGALFICLGSALLTEFAGFSLALGAFLAGILISESDYHYQIESEITPFRDVFNSIFFISIGMLINIKFVLNHWQTLLIFTGSIMLLKSIIIFIVASILLLPFRTKILTSTGLSQIGEFSFILVSTGFMYKLLPYDHYQYAIAVTVITMLLTPLLISILPSILKSGRLTDKKTKQEKILSDHIIISGYGLTGQHLAKVLQSSNMPYIVTEINGQTVKQNKKAGINIIYGDTSKRTILEKCSIQNASVIVIAITDPYALRQTIRLARQMNKNIFIIARSNRLDEMQELIDLSADRVIAQEFESSIEIVTHVLERLHLPQNIIRMEAKLLRQDGYQMLRSHAPEQGISDQVMNLLTEGVTTTFMILENHAAANKEIRQLDLRNKTGVTILAVMRGDKPNKNPSPDFILLPNDVLILTGAHAQIDRAFVYLEHGIDQE